ncbi:outer membrane assembly lipoprotein YfiO [Corchorus olitorius]|uniref:Outer membrane assembly lipoprotein YfiO n=1 Tax=Corchorus olitorius TaxID=93759 RepID=A0A1R3HMN1_9ROSI|nr:outer membrane assembly lipoprotein YfiO [Corchorus olitorius]
MTIETSLKALSLGKKQTPILHYVPKVRRKEGQSPFLNPLEFEDAELCFEKLKQNVQSYGPNAYKLIAKAGFNLFKPTAVDELHTEKTIEKLQGITDAHQN